MALTPDFTATGPMLLRLSALERGALSAPLPRPAADGSFAGGDLAAYLRALAGHAVFRETVEVSSGSLAAVLGKVEADAPVEAKHLLKASLSMARYALRVTDRPTPFGLSAGVSPLRTADRARAVIDGPGSRHVRIDAGWFAEQAGNWLEQPHFRHAADVLVNDLCFVRGDRLVLSCGRDEYRSREVTVRCTSFVRWVLAEAARPVNWTALLDRAAAAHPSVDRDRLDALLLQLARREFLITSLTPQSLDEKAVGRILDILGGDTDEGRRLTALRAVMDEFEKEPAGGGSGLWRSLHLSSGATGPDVSVAHVDLAMAADVAIPPAVTEEVERYASALWAMTPHTDVYSHMREYREAFTDKYGEAGAVRLPELIDPHTGLGFPRGYGNPPVSRDARLAAYEGNEDEARDGRRLEVLGRLIQRGMLSPDREIDLSPADVEALTTERATPPPALELTFQLLADRTGDLDRGDFVLVAAPMIGSATAGASMGRFAAMTGIEEQMGALLRAPAPDGITAQLAFKPMNSRAGNVTQVGRLVPHEITVGTMPDPDSPFSLDWRDLLVAADGERLRLVHAPTREEVHPVVPHMLNLEMQSPNLVRLLAEMKHTGAPSILQVWDWSGFGAAPWLPRVRLGKTVISPLRWRPSLAMRDSARSAAAFGAALEEWRGEFSVPDRVGVSQADSRYEIDLRAPFHQELLRRDLIKSPHVRITESLQALGSYGWVGGRANEITVPLVAREAATAPRPVLVADPVPAVHHSPGGEWFYAELSSVPETHDELVCALDDMLRPRHDQMDSWHFVRFFHPEPHVRLRVRSTDPDVAAGLKAQLDELRARRLIRAFRVCPYEPETARYGGPGLMAETESVFCLDSQTAAAQLRLLRAGRGLSREQLAVADYSLMLDALMPGEWPQWIGGLFPRSTDGSLPRKLISDTARLVVPGEAATRLAEVLEMPGLADAWRTTAALETLATALADTARRTGSQAARRHTVLSFLHMQHNRLIGVDRSSELRTLTLLAHIARAHTDRLKHHRGDR
ncbi:lantibiotic dehydratase [Streptomyces sp. CLCI03]